MPFAAIAGTDPIVANYRDRLIDEKRALFFWDRMTGMTSKRDDAMVGREAWPSEVRTSGKPVLVIPIGSGKYDGGGPGTNKWRMGMKVEYNTKGVAGDATAKDTGGIDVLYYHEVITHRRRLVKPVRVGRYNESLGGGWGRQLVADSGPDLMELHMRDKGWGGVAHALFYGHSEHAIYDANIGVGFDTAAAVGGLGETIRLHENICIPGLPAGRGAGYRYATWSANHATHMAAIAANLAEMTNENQFKCGPIWLQIVEQELRSKCRNKRVNLKAGQPEFWLAVTDAQWMQLKADPVLREQLIFDHPGSVDQSELYLGNASFRYGGLRVFRGGYRGPTRIYSYYPTDTLATENGPGLATDNGDAGNAAANVVFGFVDDDFAPYAMADSSIEESETTDDGTKPWLSRDVAIGGSYVPMIHGVQRYAPEFMKEDDDFENQKQLAIDTDYGFSRISHYNNPSPASATAVIQDRSGLFVSYSPNNIVA